MKWDINVCLVLQVCLEIAVCLTTYTTVVALAFPSILNPAILASDADFKVTANQVLWIAACVGLGGLLTIGFLSTVFEIYGRKTANILTNSVLLSGSLILYAENDIYSLAFARLTQGISITGSFTASLSLCGCVSPKRRGYFMVLNKVSLGLGSFTCHTLGFVLHWRQITLIGALGNLVSIIIFVFCAESPSYLAMSGQFEKCIETLQWYRGKSINSNKELKELITAQTERLRLETREKIT